MTDYRIKFNGNCPEIDLSVATTFSIDPALNIVQDTSALEVFLTAGISNVFQGSTHGLQAINSDNFPAALSTQRERAQDGIKRLVASGACSFQKGDKFILVTQEDAKDPMPPVGHDFSQSAYARLGKPNEIVIATVITKDKIEFLSEDGVSEVFDRALFFVLQQNSTPVKVPARPRAEGVDAANVHVLRL